MYFSLLITEEFLHVKQHRHIVRKHYRNFPMFKQIKIQEPFYLFPLERRRINIATICLWISIKSPHYLICFRLDKTHCVFNLAIQCRMLTSSSTLSSVIPVISFFPFSRLFRFIKYFFRLDYDIDLLFWHCLMICNISTV